VVWFLGLLPITYVFGKVWCGWVCHLGALQEFLHRQNQVAFLDGDRAQLAMRHLRHLFLGALLVQLAWTRENLFVHIDPFKVAFNLRSYYLTGWLLLGLLLLSALYVHRPFCRAVCPIGLVLGWVGRLPGALRLATDTSCRTCGRCGSRCQLHAIDAQVRVSSEDCVLCGNCLNACKSLSMHPTHTRPARPVSQAVPGPASHGATE
jgi:polyferredoxin